MDTDEQGAGAGPTRLTRIVAAAAGAVLLVGLVAAVAIASQDDDAPNLAVRTNDTSDTPSSTDDHPGAAIGNAVSTVAPTTEVAPPPLSPATSSAGDDTPQTEAPVVDTQSPPPAVAPSVTTVPPPSGTRVVPHPEAVAPYHTISFDPAGASPDGNAVLVRFWNGNEHCYLLHDFAVNETATTVTVTLTGGAKADVEVCTEEAIYFEVRVPLSAPLGARTLISGG